jgi:starch synthase
MKILFAASECFPFIKTGGLADVVGSLPKELVREGAEVSVMLPKYTQIDEYYIIRMQHVCHFNLQFGSYSVFCGIDKLEQDGVNFYFIDNLAVFGGDKIYTGDEQEGFRFAFFCRAVLESFKHMNYYPDVIHCNDWQTALIPVFLRDFYPEYNGVRTLFTIHNIEYQGIMPPVFAGDVAGLFGRDAESVEFGGNVNLMKGAIVRSDGISTVSQTYSREIMYEYYSHGLHNILSSCSFKLYGIVNGIDTAVYDPATDPFIEANYSADNFAGKAENKRFLQQSLGLKPDAKIPLIGMVTRLASHKGIDLVERVIDEIVGCGVQFAVLGTGDERFEEMFRQAHARHPDMISASITFSSRLASQIYAGCDIFLMPSKSEPCGLSQMVAMRYGAVPVVRETGGLKDTVPAYKIIKREGRGFTFWYYNAHEMMGAVRRATAFYRAEPEEFAGLQKRNMLCDFSWNVSVKKYIELYKSLTGAE